MAHYTTGTAVGPGAVAAFFDALHAQLIANGWTDLDVISSVSGSKDVVMQGSALDAGGFYKPYVRITQTSTTAFFVRAYQDWDPTTHVGVNEANNASTGPLTLQDTSFTYWIRANGLAFIAAAKIGATYNRAYAGLLRRGLPAKFAGITKSTGALAIGATSIPVASDMTGKLAVGQKVMLFNYAHSSASANKGNAELVTISSISATAIGVSATIKAYDAGAIVGERILPGLVASYGGSTDIGGAVNPVVAPDGSYTSQTGQQLAKNNVLLEPSNATPNTDSNKFGAGFLNLSVSTAGKSGSVGSAYHLIFAATSANTAAEDVFDDGTNQWLATGGANPVPCIGPINN